MPNEMLDAMKVFSQGIKRLSVTRSLNQANENIQQIRSQEMDDADRTNAMREVASNLGINLMKTGMSAKEAKQAGEAINPTPPGMSTLERQMIIQQRGQNFRQNQQLKSFEQQDKALAAREKISLGKEKRTAIGKQKHLFIKELKGLRTAVSKVKAMGELIDLDSPMAASAAGVLMARGSGEVGNLSKAEQVIWKGRQDYLSKILRWVSVGATSKMTEGDKKALKGVIKAYQKMSKREEEEVATIMTGQLFHSKMFIDDDPNQILTEITGGKYRKYKPESLEDKVEQEVVKSKWSPAVLKQAQAMINNPQTSPKQVKQLSEKFGISVKK